MGKCKSLKSVVTSGPRRPIATRDASWSRNRPLRGARSTARRLLTGLWTPHGRADTRSSDAPRRWSTSPQWPRRSPQHHQRAGPPDSHPTTHAPHHNSRTAHGEDSLEPRADQGRSHDGPDAPEPTPTAPGQRRNQGGQVAQRTGRRRQKRHHHLA